MNSADLNDNTIVPTKMKHVELDDAIMSISNINEELTKLISEIEGSTLSAPSNESTAPATRPLATVLNEGPFWIKNFTEAAIKDINYIRMLLFFR